MRYVTYNEEGELTGCYFQDLAPDHVDCHIEIAESLASTWTQYCANAGRDGVEVRPSGPQSIESHNAPILAALLAIDAQSIRPLRSGDAVRVAALEQQATALRAQLRKD